MEQHTYGLMARIEDTHWWFAGRRRLIDAVVADALSKTHAAGAPRMLDIGCGTGANLSLLSRYGDAEGLDREPAALEFCRARGLDRVTLGSAEALPWDDATFNLVTALDVVEHLDDDTGALREMARVLRPGGRSVLFVPAFMFLWGVQDEVSHHKRRYTLPGLRDVMARAGFEVERITYANITLFAPILAGRVLMRVLGLKPASENNINHPVLDRPLAALFGAERHWIARGTIPFGVSLIAVGRKPG